MHATWSIPKAYAPRTFTVRVTTVVCIFFLLILIGLDLTVFHTALFDSYAYISNGAYSQYINVKNLIDQNEAGKEMSENPIFVAHLFRYAIYWPFMYLNENAISLEYALVAAISFPVINYYYTKKRYVLLFLPLTAAYFISFRTVLAAMSIGYIVIFLFSNRRYPYLLMGLLLSFLSSAVTLQVILLLSLYCWFRDPRLLFKINIFIPFVLFSINAAMVIAKKLDGFALGDVGYAATTAFSQTNILLSILSRSTLYLDLVRGNIRGYAYALIAGILLFAILRAAFTKDPVIKDHRFVILALSPGFLVEGLGVMSIMMVLIWALLRIDLVKKSANNSCALI